MKKVISIVIMVMITVQLINAGEVITQDVNRLPAEARNFINQHFSDATISHIKIDSEFLRSKKYEVAFTNGMEIDFDSRGNWKEVDAKKQAVPADIIPARIREYTNSNFSNNFITKIERDRRGFEIELNNDLNLKFDRNGLFIRLDD